jgi:aminopeptidase-like protein
MKFRNKMLALPILALLGLAGCDRTDADVASYNISKAADNFEINRRIVFINTFTNDYVLVIEGLCSLGNSDTNLRMSVTCKTGPSTFKKHHLGLGANVTFVSEQLDAAKASTYHYRVVFKPSTLMPNIEIR